MARCSGCGVGHRFRCPARPQPDPTSYLTQMLLNTTLVS